MLKSRIFIGTSLPFVAVLLAFGQVGASAEQVYKSIDADGNVTYSTSPAPEAVESSSIALPAPPSTARQTEALQQQRQMEEAARVVTGSVDRERNRQRADVGEAKKRLDEAKARLNEVRTPQNDDWQYIAGGGRYLKQSYHDRVKQAEEEWKAAMKALEEARRDAR